ncbi:MAG TPA: serine hydrolase domain-containing protein [Candidatus Binatus sp.]|nr:serine hydrolase domain-containing protein [Candidatus Binatus sp.]
MSARRIAAFAVVVVMAFFCGQQAGRAAAAGSPSSDATLRAALQKDINAYLAAHAQEEHISALSLSVSLPNRPDNINLTTGRMSYQSGGPVPTDSLWQIGSVTKSFTSAVLLQLEAEGKLNIDQTVGYWLPQYPAWRSVSIRRLLDMTSGIPGYDLVPAMGWSMTTIHRRYEPAQLIAFADPIYPNAPKPTTGYNYSNTNYLLAGLIIERVTGNSYASELQRRFFGPLGLKDTYYSPNVYPASVTSRMVSGYWFNTGPGNEPFARFLRRDMRLSDMSWAGAAGAIVSTPEDVTRWARALHTGDVLASKQKQELHTIVSLKNGKPIATTALADRSGFGLGVAQMTMPKLGTFWFYEGETLGYRMTYVWFPKSNVVFAVGINSQPTKDHVGALMQAIWQSLHNAGVL